jgi:ribosomal protein S6
MAKKEIETTDVDVQDVDHAEARVYELAFHIDCDLPVEEAKKVYQAIRSKIESVGSIVAEGEPQKIPLAYTISRGETAGRRDFDSSFFAWIAYETDGAGHEAVALLAKEDKRIFRFLDIRTTKEEAKHSAEMSELLAKMEPEETEEVSDTELDAALKEVGV